MGSKFAKLLDEVNNDSKNLHRDSRVLLIDGMNLFLRNFAALNLINSEGTHIGGLGGTLVSLRTLINVINPTSAYVIFDGVGSTNSRKNLFSDYKKDRNINRITKSHLFETVGDEYDSKTDQISRLIHYLKCLPVKIISTDGAEADDVIAYMSSKFEKDSKVFIVSMDGDFLQLIDERITVYNPIKKVFITPKDFYEKFGFQSENFIIYKSLIGDNSDKIRGITDVGPKSLLSYFPEIKTQKLELEDIFRLSEERFKKSKIYTRILTDQNLLETNYKLMDLKNPLLGDEEKQQIDEIINESITPLNTLGFNTLYNQDGLINVIRNREMYLHDTFRVLNSFTSAI